MTQPSSIQSNGYVRAHDFRRIKRYDSCRICCRLESDLFPEELWFDANCGDPGDLAVDEPNWVAIALIYPAMLTGQDLIIDAKISPRLLHFLNGDLQGLLIAYDPRLQPIRVEARVAPLPESLGNGVATGFSAGIDSFATFLSYSGQEVPESLRITHLMVHNVGAFGHTSKTAAAYNEACLRTAAVANDFGMETIFIASNMDDLFHSCQPPSRIFEHTHSLRNAAAAHVFHKSLSYFLYSSAYSYYDVGVSVLKRSTNQSTAYLDPILLPLLSTERLIIVSAGAKMSRGEKTALVSESQLARGVLDVCVSGPKIRQACKTKNCSRCWKCVRTMATLEALGALDHFAQVFDLEHYRAHRAELLRPLHENAKDGNPADQEVISLLRQAGLSIPEPRARAIKGFIKLASRSRRKLEHILRRND